jgi:hypothetical protein
MAVTETTTTSYGQNLKNKFAAIGTGVVLFIASFVLLWISQGQTNYGRIAQKKSTIVAPDTIDPANENKLISVTANLVSTEKLGDPLFIVPGSYLVISRSVEMYAWVEKSKSENVEKPAQTETGTTYGTKRNGHQSPEFSSSTSPYPRTDHDALESKTFEVETRLSRFLARSSEYVLPAGASDTLRSIPIKPNSARRSISATDFPGNGSMANPQIGDVRVSFRVLANPTYVTVFGKQTGSTIRRWTDEKKEDISLFRAIAGDREAAIATMKTEFKTLVLILTIGGFLCMWIGLQMMFGFIPGLLQVLPFLKDASKFIISLILFPIALVLSLITIGISAIAHNIIVLIIVLAVLLVLIIVLATRKKQPSAA